VRGEHQDRNFVHKRFGLASVHVSESGNAHGAAVIFCVLSLAHVLFPCPYRPPSAQPRDTLCCHPSAAYSDRCDIAFLNDTPSTALYTCHPKNTAICTCNS